GTSFKSGAQHLVVCRISADALQPATVLDDIRDRDDVRQPQKRLPGIPDVLADLVVAERSFDLRHDAGRDHNFEGVPRQELNGDLTRWAARADHRADQHVRVEKSAEQGYLRDRFGLAFSLGSCLRAERCASSASFIASSLESWFPSASFCRSRNSTACSPANRLIF